MVRIGYYQFAPVFGDKTRNLEHLLDALAGVEADIVVLPELPFTGYLFRDRVELEEMAEDPAESAIVESLTGLCKARDFYCVTGFAERAPGACFNSALLLGPEGLVHTYRKLHLFCEEKTIFEAGDRPLAVHEIAGIRMGMMICFDWALPEVARTLALKGADVICHPSNLVLDYCQQTMKARCIENSIFAVTANRYGTDERTHGTVTFTGRSQIVDPRGNVLHRSTRGEDDLVIVDIDVNRARDKKITPWNDLLGDRRPEFYRELCADDGHNGATQS